jgi:hypothetical protein
VVQKDRACFSFYKGDTCFKIISQWYLNIIERRSEAGRRSSWRCLESGDHGGGCSGGSPRLLTLCTKDYFLSARISQNK